MNDNDLKFRTKKFSIDIIHFYKELPSSVELKVIGKQLLRSATSVGANTRAAYRGRSRKEFIAKIGIVIEEADESCFWLELLEEIYTKKGNNILKLKNEANELTAIFTSTKKKYKM